MDPLSYHSYSPSPYDHHQYNNGANDLNLGLMTSGRPKSPSGTTANGTAGSAPGDAAEDEKASNNHRHPILTFLLVLLFVTDIASDICTGVELILNDHLSWGFAVLGVVAAPVVLSIVAELLRGCVYSGCCGEASTDWIPLIFYHLYTVIM